MKEGPNAASGPDASVRGLRFVLGGTGIGLAFVAALVVLVVVLALLPRPISIPGPPAPVLFFGPPSISGNQTSGWTFRMPVHLSAWVTPGQMRWRNVTFRIDNETNGGPSMPYPIPTGTTLYAFAPSGSVSPPYGPMVAEYNLTAASWQSGGSAAIQDGQWIVLHGMIPPGHHKINGTSSTFSGPSLVTQSTFRNGVMRMYVLLTAD